MKPDWKNAPEWANWLAMDKDGGWLWFEREPFFHGGRWWRDNSDSRFLEALPRPAPREHLEERPQS